MKHRHSKRKYFEPIKSFTSYNFTIRIGSLSQTMINLEPPTDPGAALCRYVHRYLYSDVYPDPELLEHYPFPDPVPDPDPTWDIKHNSTHPYDTVPYNYKQVLDVLC
jgi:hypothetical protein